MGTPLGPKYIPYTYMDPLGLYYGRTPHPVIVTIKDNGNCIRVLLYSYYITIIGWGVLLIYIMG